MLEEKKKFTTYIWGLNNNMTNLSLEIPISTWKVNCKCVTDILYLVLIFKNTDLKKHLCVTDIKMSIRVYTGT